MHNSCSFFLKTVRSLNLNNNVETNVNEYPDNRWKISFFKHTLSILSEESLVLNRLITLHFARPASEEYLSYSSLVVTVLVFQ